MQLPEEISEGSMIIIDKIIDKTAYIEISTNNKIYYKNININKLSLSKDIREGDIFLYKNGSFIKSNKIKNIRKKEIDNLFQELINKGKDCDEIE